MKYQTIQLYWQLCTFVWQQTVEFIKKSINHRLSKQTNMKKYYSLMHLGINAYAFPKQQALIIISKLKEKNVTILGGDVYCLKK